MNSDEEFETDTQHAYECDNCGTATTEHGPCHECGAKPWESR